MLDTRDNTPDANIEAYVRDLKFLLEKHYGEYVVYQNGARVTVEKDIGSARDYVSKNSLRKSGLSVLIQHIEPLDEEQIRILRNTNEGCKIKSCENLVS